MTQLVLNQYLLSSLRFGDSNNSHGLSNLEGHVLYKHTLFKKEGKFGDTVYYCLLILLTFIRSNYYYSFRQKTALAIVSANSPVLTLSLEIAEHVFSVISPLTGWSNIPALSCPEVARDIFLYADFGRD